MLKLSNRIVGLVIVFGFKNYKNLWVRRIIQSFSKTVEILCLASLIFSAFSSNFCCSKNLLTWSHSRYSFCNPRRIDTTFFESLCSFDSSTADIGISYSKACSNLFLLPMRNGRNCQKSCQIVGELSPERVFSCFAVKEFKFDV